jgi:hypothetical protein
MVVIEINEPYVGSLGEWVHLNRGGNANSGTVALETEKQDVASAATSSRSDDRHRIDGLAPPSLDPSAWHHVP